MPTATGICRTIDDYPRLQRFLRNIVQNNILVTTRVHESFQYHKEIIQNKLYPHYGIFIDFFIRRLICEFRNENFYDPRVQKLKNIDENFDEHIVEILKADEFSIDLNIIENVENIKNDTFDILEDLSIYSSYHFICFLQDKLTNPFSYFDIDYLRCIKNHIKKSFDFDKGILSNPSLDCDYFAADCDIIYNDFIIVIRNSRFQRTKSDFYQLLLYAFGYYKSSGIIIKKFKFYSTLLGLEYVMVLREDLNMIEFERMLINDVFRKTEVDDILQYEDMNDDEKQRELRGLEIYVQEKLENLNLDGENNLENE